MNNPYSYMEEYKGQTLDYKNFCELVIEQLFAQIILNIRETRNEHEYDIPTVELGKEWR